jgi:lysozyme
MKPLSRIYRSIMISVMTVVMSGVFTILTQVEAEAQTACTSWLRVVDISSNNIHPIDWIKAVKGGVAGAYIKNTESTNYVNPYFTTDKRNATAAGVPWGVYHFAQPGKSDPVASAKFFIANGGALGQLPPALDLEVTTLNPLNTAKWALTWLQTVQALSGRKPIIYVGYYFPASQYGFLAPYDLWLPAYSNGYQPAPNVCALARPKVPAPWRVNGWSMWQFTSIATPSGLPGHIDLSAVEMTWFSKWTGAGILPGNNGKPGDPLYSFGSHGTKVSEIQNLLISKGFLPKGSADGVFGSQTKHAVEAWQVKVGVTADGAWSLNTQTASDFYLKNGYTLKQKATAIAMSAMMHKFSLELNAKIPNPTTTTIPKKGKK